jgi:hypothetical protein
MKQVASSRLSQTRNQHEAGSKQSAEPREIPARSTQLGGATWFYAAEFQCSCFSLHSTVAFESWSRIVQQAIALLGGTVLSLALSSVLLWMGSSHTWAVLQLTNNPTQTGVIHRLFSWHLSQPVFLIFYMVSCIIWRLFYLVPWFSNKR